MCPQRSSSTQFPVKTLTNPTLGGLAVNQVCKSHCQTDEVSSDEVLPVGDPPPIAPPPPAAVQVSDPGLTKIKLLSTISREDILRHIHHPDTKPFLRFDHVTLPQAQLRRNIIQLKNSIA